MSPCSADEQKERMIGMTKRLNLLLEFVMLTLGAVIAALLGKPLNSDEKNSLFLTRFLTEELSVSVS